MERVQARPNFDPAVTRQKFPNSPVFDPVTRAARNSVDTMRDYEPDPGRMLRDQRDFDRAKAGGRTEYVTREPGEPKASPAPENAQPMERIRPQTTLPPAPRKSSEFSPADAERMRSGQPITQPDRSTLKPEQQKTWARLRTYLDPNSSAGYPLTRLGMMDSDQGTVRRFQERINVLGLTVTKTLKPGEKQQPLMDTAMKQAGLDPYSKSSIGKIAVGPMFDEEDSITLEHEMMHKAILEHFPGKIGKFDEEVLLRTITNTPDDQDWLKEEVGPDWKEKVKPLEPVRRELEQRARALIAEKRRSSAPSNFRAQTTTAPPP